MQEVTGDPVKWAHLFENWARLRTERLTGRLERAVRSLSLQLASPRGLEAASGHLWTLATHLPNIVAFDEAALLALLATLPRLQQQPADPRAAAAVAGYLWAVCGDASVAEQAVDLDGVEQCAAALVVGPEASRVRAPRVRERGMERGGGERGGRRCREPARQLARASDPDPRQKRRQLLSTDPYLLA